MKTDFRDLLAFVVLAVFISILALSNSARTDRARIVALESQLAEMRENSRRNVVNALPESPQQPAIKLP